MVVNFKAVRLQVMENSGHGFTVEAEVLESDMVESEFANKKVEDAVNKLKEVHERELENEYSRGWDDGYRQGYVEDE